MSTRLHVVHSVLKSRLWCGCAMQFFAASVESVFVWLVPSGSRTHACVSMACHSDVAVFQKSVLPEWPARMLSKRVPEECLQECPCNCLTNVKQECVTRVPHKNAPQGASQERPTTLQEIPCKRVDVSAPQVH